MTAYVQSLRAAAKDGVDVRLLAPNATDIPLLKPLSRAGYRAVLEAGVRVFEWMERCSRQRQQSPMDVGRESVPRTSTSPVGNCEMDVVVEDAPFTVLMEEMFLGELENAKQKVRAPNEPRHLHPVLTSGGGSAGRAGAGAVRIASVVAAAFTNRSVREPVEARITATAGIALLTLAILFAFFPLLLAYPLNPFCRWIACTLLYRG